MSINTYNITENKTTENTKSKKDNIIDIKQNLFQQMTTQSSRKFKNRENDENTFSSPKFHKNKNFKNCEENKSIYYDNYEKSLPKDGLRHKSNQKNTGIKSEKKRNKNKKISAIKNDNDIMAYFSKNQNKNVYPLNDSNSNENEKNNNFDTDKFNNNSDLVYVLSTQKDVDKNSDENDTELDSYERLTSHVALPFCHYHKYNIKLPKQYTCNFKNCSCCGCLRRKKLQNLQDSNRYQNKPDYIYPVINSEKKKTKFRSVLDKFRKNKNNNINTLSGESNQLGDSRLIFSKPNNTNLKIAKKDYIIENSNDGSESNDNNNDIENGKNYYYLDDNSKNGNDYNLNDENRLYGDNKSKNGNEYYNDNNNNYYYYDNTDNSNNDNNENNNGNNFNDAEHYDKNKNNSQNKNIHTNKDKNDEINNTYTNNENYRNKDGNDYNVYNNIYGDNKIETEYNNNSNDNNNDDNAFNKNKIDNIYKDENYITEKESENNFNESSLLELPYDCNDDTNLNRYKHLVNKSEKKPKIHFSVMYYKRLNKSFNQIYSKDLKNRRSKSNINFKGVNKNKRVEFLRE